MRCFTVNWNNNKGEAEIKFADWFTPKAEESYTRLIMMDAISDVMAELQKVYDELYAETYKDKKMTDKEAPTYYTDAHAVSMTLRDYFAAKALDYAWNHSIADAGAAARAYSMADEMLEARK